MRGRGDGEPGPRRLGRTGWKPLAAAAVVATFITTGCASADAHLATVGSGSPQPTASRRPAASAPSGASEAADASAVLPTAGELGSGWGPASNQDHAADGSLVYLWALTHCMRLASLATGSGSLDGPSFDPGFAALAHRVHWVALSNNPDLSRTGRFQEQDVLAYAGPTNTFTEVTAALQHCSTSPLPSRTVDVTPAVPPTVPAGVHVAAYGYAMGQMLAQVVVLSARGLSVVADVQDAASTAGQPADPDAEAALVRRTARVVASAMTN